MAPGYGTNRVTFDEPLLAVQMLVPSKTIPKYGLVAPAGSAKLTPAPVPGSIRVTFDVDKLAIQMLVPSKAI